MRCIASLPLALVCLVACTRPADVEVVSPRRGLLEESFREPGRTWLAHTFTVTMPVDGRIARIALDPGDSVEAGAELVALDRTAHEARVAEARAVVAELEAQLALGAYDALEATLREEASRASAAMASVVAAAQLQVEAGETLVHHRERELARVQALAAAQEVSEHEVDRAVLDHETAALAWRAQVLVTTALEVGQTVLALGPRTVDEWLARKRLAAEALEQRLLQARARLGLAEHELSLARLPSPITGTVLARHAEGGAPYPAGTELLSLGDPEELEAVADVLTQDAQRLAVGSRVELASPASATVFTGRVARIEPAGFTKLSSLGVEQQRVRVRVALDERPPGLGVGFRLELRFLTGRRDDALVVPRTAVLQDRSGATYVVLVESGRARRAAVQLGLRSDLELEVLGELPAGARLVAAPDATLRDGDRVRVLE